jgi:saccharopine dehydrogenase-like NADP-dependent oxidoreductase
LTVDVYDEKSLDAFCAGCDVIVNCTGPSWVIKDRVIQASIKKGCHYIDPGIWYDKEGRYGKEFERKGKTGLLYAGWIPGISGLLPRYVYAEALKRFDRVTGLDEYLGDRSVWSPNASHDVIYHYVRDIEPGYFREGRWVKKFGLYSVLGAKIYEHPGNIGRYVVTPVEATELVEFAAESRIPHIRCYAGIAGLGTIIRITYIRYSSISDEKAVKILMSAFKNEADRYGPGGAVSCVLTGIKDGKKKSIAANVVEADTVWLTGACTVLALRMLVGNRVKGKGLRFFCDAVDPAEFFRELDAIGVKTNIVEK